MPNNSHEAINTFLLRAQTRSEHLNVFRQFISSFAHENEKKVVGLLIDINEHLINFISAYIFLLTHNTLDAEDIVQIHRIRTEQLLNNFKKNNADGLYHFKQKLMAHINKEDVWEQSQLPMHYRDIIETSHPENIHFSLHVDYYEVLSQFKDFKQSIEVQKTQDSAARKPLQSAFYDDNPWPNTHDLFFYLKAQYTIDSASADPSHREAVQHNIDAQIKAIAEQLFDAGEKSTLRNQFRALENHYIELGQQNTWYYEQWQKARADNVALQEKYHLLFEQEVGTKKESKRIIANESRQDKEPATLRTHHFFRTEHAISSKPSLPPYEKSVSWHKALRSRLKHT